MPNETRDILRDIYAKLRTKGFRKLGAAAVRPLSQTTLVVEFQKSNYGALYYINIGLMLRVVASDTKTIRTAVCDISWRPQDRGLDAALDWEHELRDPSVLEFAARRGGAWDEATVRAKYLEAWIDGDLERIAGECATHAGVRERLLRGDFSDAAVTLRAKEVLQVPLT